MKTLLFGLIIASSLFATTYDDAYQVVDQKNLEYTQEKNQFIYGAFKEIVRFDMLHFRGDELDEDSQEIYNRAVEMITEYIKNNETILVNVIGHSNDRTDVHNELVADSDTYMNAILNIFRRSHDLNESIEDSKNYALRIADDLNRSGIDKNITILEYRGDKDKAFTIETSKGLDLSNRVMLTMYVLEDLKKIKFLDDDCDGVSNKNDECPNTPDGEPVNKVGCPLDGDNDGVQDHIDECPQTPEGYSVNEVGCADAVTLQVNFGYDSDEFPEELKAKAAEFSQYLLDYPDVLAHVIGHTSKTKKSKAKYNLNLSMKRAKSVVNEIINNGVAENRLTYDGKGFTQPIADNATEEGRFKNRRVEIKFSKKYQ